MSNFKNVYNKGVDNTAKYQIIVCGVVRDCGKALKNNIKSIERLCDYFTDYQIIIFENNSKDNTKNILQEWSLNNKKIKIFIDDFDESKYLKIVTPSSFKPGNSKKRIQKMVDYRNLYMDYIQKNNLQADFLCVVDLDVSKIDVKGAITSFGVEQAWDAITANGTSKTFYLRKRYHDTYALTEEGLINSPQTIPQIEENRFKWNFLKKGMPLIKVASAYGGLCFYKFDIVKNLKYKLVENNYAGVEVRCEHFSIHKQMYNNGFTNIFINPNMHVKYQRIDIKLIYKKIKSILKSI
jgi:hypothetical protein